MHGKPNHSANRNLYYSIQIGVDCIGVWSDPSVLEKMENQFQSVWQMFLNATDSDVSSIQHNNNATTAINASELAAAAYRHPISNKPLIVLYAEPEFAPIWFTENLFSIYTVLILF